MSSSGDLAVLEVPSFRVTATWPSAQLQSLARFQPRSFCPFPRGVVVDARTVNEPDAFRSFSWWDDEHLAIQTYGGFFLVSTLSVFQNILGQSIDQIAEHSALSDAIALSAADQLRRLLVLEQSTTYLDSESQQVSLFAHDQASAEPSLLTNLKHYILNGGYTSKPFNPRVTLQTRSLNLLVIQTITPMECISRKLKLEEFGTAVELARAHGIDVDIVYKHQWIVSRLRFCPIEALSKVHDVYFVLGECLNFVPAKWDNLRRLIDLGCSKTQEPSFIQQAEV